MSDESEQIDTHVNLNQIPANSVPLVKSNTENSRINPNETNQLTFGNQITFANETNLVSSHSSNQSENFQTPSHVFLDPHLPKLLWSMFSGTFDT